MPQAPMPVEMLIKQLMGVLMIEIRAERGFAFNVALLRDPENFTDRRAQAEQAATLVDQIRQDEAPHVAYLQLFISELRMLHFKTPNGLVEGKTFIDPLWAKIAAWNSEDVPRAQQASTRAQVEACLKALPNGAAVLRRYDELAEADAPEPAAA
jgi:hypothetical protein